jgi:hypothetical protein
MRVGFINFNKEGTPPLLRVHGSAIKTNLNLPKGLLDDGIISIIRGFFVHKDVMYHILFNKVADIYELHEKFAPNTRFLTVSVYGSIKSALADNTDARKLLQYDIRLDTVVDNQKMSLHDFCDMIEDTDQVYFLYSK